MTALHPVYVWQSHQCHTRLIHSHHHHSFVTPCAAGDKSAMVPGGMRIGTPALTTRGFKEADFVQVANFIDRAVNIAKDCQQKTPAPGKVFVWGHMHQLRLRGEFARYI